MPIEKVIADSGLPWTKAMLKSDLRTMGLTPGDKVLVHSSLSRIGWVIGGARTVIEALLETITADGTVIMPAQSADLSDPSEWSNPPIPEDWWETVRQNMPAYHPTLTPTVGMGAIAEMFRAWPGAIRSAHPAFSFAGWGRSAENILREHPIDFGLGEGSPLARMYAQGFRVLLIGAAYDSNTSFHLAEYRQPHVQKIRKGAPVLENGYRIWKRYDDIDFDTDVFEAVGRDFETDCAVMVGKIGKAGARLFGMKACVDYAENWLRKRSKN